MDEIYDHVLALTKESGVVLLEGIKDCGAVEIKTNFTDLVTVYDGKIEEILVEGIKKKYPHHKFIAEESSHNFNIKPTLTDEPTWIIDPIDGTINFVHAVPFVCISVAFVVNQELEMAFLYNPCMNELYTARRGQGAFLNGKQIFASKVTTMKSALLAYEVSLASIPAFLKKNILRTQAFVSQCLGIRALGSAALTLCFVARGIIDAYNVEDLKPWDIAAGALLVQEAGGIVIDKKGGSFNIMRPDVITAGTKELSEIVLKIVTEIDEQIEKEQ